MKANSLCKGAQHLDIYLNGEKQLYALQADEEAGKVWVAKRRDGRTLSVIMDAEDGDLIDCHGGIVVEKLTGEVEIRITLPEGVSVEEVRREIAETYHPILFHRIEVG